MLRLLLALFLDESICASLLRTARWHDDVHCLRCYSSRVKRYGKYRRVFQRYYCNDCHHTFNDKTGTIFHYSHIPLSEWFLAVYMFCIPWMGMSISSISNQLSIPYRICYHMIRGVMERIASTETIKLDGMVEVDELYTHAGMKGRSYHAIIIAMQRMPRRRGVRPWRGRGTFQKDTPMVMCYHQRNGSTVFDVPQHYDSISSLLCKNVDYGSTVYTDDYVAYMPLKEHGFKHSTVCHSSREYANGCVHTNNCECRTNLFKLWLAKFMGVNKFNLQLYAKTFQFLHNHTHLDNYEKFMKVLSILVIATTLYIMSELFIPLRLLRSLEVFVETVHHNISMLGKTR